LSRSLGLSRLAAWRSIKQRMRKGLNYRRSSVCFKSISNLRKNGSDVSGKRPIVAIEAELKPKMVETFDNVADTYKRLRRLQDQDSVVVVGSEAAFGCVVLLALIVQRRDDRGLRKSEALRHVSCGSS
jgi:hypothetical protein